LINKADILFGGIMAFAMSFLMSLVMTYVSVGLVPDFITIWLRSFVIGMIVSFPIALFITPIAAKIVKTVVKA
tara:strand:- start:816 stop:1034 length:219 start_codon:yes stop_codon:yes gene_type:complete